MGAKLPGSTASKSGRASSTAARAARSLAVDPPAPLRVAAVLELLELAPSAAPAGASTGGALTSR